MKTDTQYLEPVGFKGSKGKWYVLPPQKHIFPIVILGGTERGFVPRVCINETDTRKKGSFEATAQLISQSKELAKALQDMVELHEKKDEFNYTGYTYAVKTRLANAKQVLKEAGLSE